MHTDWSVGTGGHPADIVAGGHATAMGETAMLEWNLVDVSSSGGAPVPVLGSPGGPDGSAVTTTGPVEHSDRAAMASRGDVQDVSPLLVESRTRESSMSFGAAVPAALRKYATSSGRARRSEFWWWSLFAVLVLAAAAAIDVLVLDERAGMTGLASGAALLVLCPPHLAVTVRRLHDTGRSGWFCAVALIPVAGGIALLAECLKDSGQGANRFGQSPKYPVFPAWPWAESGWHPLSGPVGSTDRPTGRGARVGH